MTSLRFGLAAIALAIAPAAARAQSAPLASAADSAALARNAWSSAVKAIRAKDMDAAQREVDRAAAAWPVQPSYHWYRAVIAAGRRDTAALRSALTSYASLGLGRSLADTAFDSFRTSQWFKEVAARHEANRRTLVHSRTRLQLGDSTLWPEGVDYDSRSGRFYVTSVRHRTIVEVSRDGTERDMWPRNTPGIGAVLGVRVDPRRDVLWASTSALSQMSGFTPADSNAAALLEVRISDGKILRRWDLPRTSGHVLGDVTVGPRGDVFISDSFDPVLYRLKPGADSLQTIRSPLFRSLQGTAPSPDGKAVYVADYSHGLLHVDLSTGQAHRVADATGSTSVGLDGIAWFDNSIIAIQNGIAPARVVRLRLSSDGMRVDRTQVLDQNSDVADEPTAGTVIHGTREFVYVANSQWEKYSDNGTRKTSVPLTRPLLLTIPLGR